MVYLNTAPATPSTFDPSTPEAKGSCSTNLDTTFEAALEHARRLTAMFGTENAEAAIAWETVEEIRSARVRAQAVTPRAAFLRYCEENPNALESRIYDD